MRRVHVASKTKKTLTRRRVIDNSSLDKAITDDLNSQEYKLEKSFHLSLYICRYKRAKTYIYFRNVNGKGTNALDYIKNQLHYILGFHLDENFSNIFVNNVKIDERCWEI